MIVPPDQIGSAVSTDTGSGRLRVSSSSVILSIGVVLGAALLVTATSGLREAHLYRQRTGEGLKFVWVGAGLFVANVVLGVAIFASVRLSSAASTLTARRAFLSLAALIAVALVAADGLAVWVEGHGDRCIGLCG